MKFDLYYPFTDKNGVKKPGVKAKPTDFMGILEVMKGDWIKSVIQDVRAGNKDRKVELTGVTFMGTSTTGKRLASVTEPTQFVMIDIDHCKDPYQAYVTLADELTKGGEQIGFVYKTASGEGLRIILRAVMQGVTSISEYLATLEERYKISRFGKFDTVCRDLSRLSFLSTYDDIYYQNVQLMMGEVSFASNPILSAGGQIILDKEPKGGEQLFAEDQVAAFTEMEEKDFSSRLYRGIPYQTITNKYIEIKGEPGTGERHNFYNEMVKNFRTICDNDKRFLLWLLPRFGHTIEECWSQIVSICRVNTLSRIPRDFFFFLKDNGYYQPRENSRQQQLMMAEEDPVESTPDRCPYLPPVFRELVGSAPKDFVLSCINALLPIIGTLTSYLRAKYPYDNREHSTSFFSVIYAPAGTGKGFVERFMDCLFEDLKFRDYIQAERDNVYLRILSRKGANDKAPDMPHVSMRIIPAKNSEPEFLQKQRDNDGYHMFTYAAEMDSWAKGVKAAGGNKDDMIRIAWDNGEYGQQFKSANTFKGTVKLYWNVLITGTIAQVENYFKNVENGLVTRCTFTSIDNQEFALPPKWKELTRRDLEVISRFRERCDRRTYSEPCTVDPFELSEVSDDEFDSKINWRFEFNEKQQVDMSWLMPTIEAFHEEQVKRSALDVDRARDTFRRRVAVRGFRLGLLCYGLYEKPRKKDLQNCCKFVDWWMHKDLESSLRLWGERYNNLTDVQTPVAQRQVYEQLEEKFSRNDLYAICIKQGIRTPVRRIIHEWNKIGCISKIDKDTFKKTKK